MKKAKPITVGCKVAINWVLNPVLDKETGVIAGFDPEEEDLVTIKLDRITPAMQGFDDAKTGVVNIYMGHVVAL